MPCQIVSQYGLVVRLCHELVPDHDGGTHGDLTDTAGSGRLRDRSQHPALVGGSKGERGRFHAVNGNRAEG